MKLIVGATGILGGVVAQQLDGPKRALVRKGSDPAKVEALKAAGVEIALGDLKDPASLRAACEGVSTVISTASATLSRQERDSIETVDRDGQLALLEAAEAAGAEHFVFVSFPEHDLSFLLQDAKRAVEERLRESRMKHTILQPTHFLEVWCGPHLGFDVAGGKVRIFGNGKLSFVSLFDVARAVVASVDNERARDKTLVVAGPEAVSQHEVADMFEEALGKKLEREEVPAEALRAQYEGAPDPLSKSFAALTLVVASEDWSYDATELVQVLGVEPQSVRDFVRASVGR